MIKERKESLIEDLSYLDQDQIFEYIVDLGQKFTRQPEWASDDTKIPGCTSKLWLKHNVIAGNVTFETCSDSRIVDGTARLLISLVNNCCPADIVVELDELDSLPSVIGLSSQRRNGTSYLIARIKSIVRSCL